MTVSVQWEPTSKTFENRFDRYLDFEFFEHQIHWFYIMNSFMLVVFLCGIVVLILMRTLKNDYIRYAQEEEEMDIDRVTDESGWKQVHGDVFRAPANLMLLSALIGTGSQLLLLVLVVILLAIAGSLYMSRGAILSSFLIAYSFTSILSGYFGGRHYKRYGGTEWKMCMALTAVLFPGVSFGIAFLVNFVAVAYQSLAAISFVSMLVVFGIWALISVPLVIFGTIVGRNTAAKDEFPCRVLATRRPIPHNPWYLSPYFLTLAGGVMPFGSIFIEMYFVFTSVWNYKVRRARPRRRDRVPTRPWRSTTMCTASC
jgi:transmembrane 9 superfamily protein 3